MEHLVKNALPSAVLGMLQKYFFLIWNEVALMPLKFPTKFKIASVAIYVWGLGREDYWEYWKRLSVFTRI